MVKKYTPILLSIVVLIGITAGTAVWVQSFYASVLFYRSPLRAMELLPQPPSSTPPTQVVVVLIGGLGYDTLAGLDLAALKQLETVGASLAVQSLPLTYSQAAWATLITGASPEINDAPPLDVPTEEVRLLETDTLFARAHEAQQQTALLGPAEWRRLIPRNQLDYAFFVERPGVEADEAILEAALPLITQGNIDLLLIHFTQVDWAGQNQGGASGEAYEQAAGRIDDYLRQISSAMDFSRGVLVITADHGHIPDGGHGGVEPEVIWQPLILVGEKIIPGTYSDIYQTDVAPTLSTLLGLAAPAAAQGRILYELLWLDEEEKAVTQLTLAQQRIMLAEAYTAGIKNSPPVLNEILQADLTQAQVSFERNNISGSFQLALLAQQEADNQMQVTRASRLNKEKLGRLIIVLLMGSLGLVIMWRQRGPHAGSVVFAVLITVGLYHALFQLQGHSYSLSSIKSFPELPLEITRRTGVSMLTGGAIILIFLMLVNEGDSRVALQTGYGFGVLVTIVFAMPLAWAFWENGMAASWRLPDAVATFWQITSLLETMIAATLGLLMPWPIMSLSLFINVIRRRLYHSQPQTDPDVLPGLHL